MAVARPAYTKLTFLAVEFSTDFWRAYLFTTSHLSILQNAAVWVLDSLDKPIEAHEISPADLSEVATLICAPTALLLKVQAYVRAHRPLHFILLSSQCVLLLLQFRDSLPCFSLGYLTQEAYFYL